MERAADLWLPRSAWWIRDLEGFPVKAYEKVGERVDFWALSLAVSCLLTSVVLFLTHGWGRVRVLTQLFFVMKWTPTHWREKSPMLLAEGRAPAKNFSPSFDHCFTFLNHWGGGVMEGATLWRYSLGNNVPLVWCQNKCLCDLQLSSQRKSLYCYCHSSKQVSWTCLHRHNLD